MKKRQVSAQYMRIWSDQLLAFPRRVSDLSHVIPYCARTWSHSARSYMYSFMICHNLEKLYVWMISFCWILSRDWNNGLQQQISVAEHAHVLSNNQDLRCGWVSFSGSYLVAHLSTPSSSIINLHLRVSLKHTIPVRSREFGNHTRSFEQGHCG